MSLRYTRDALRDIDEISTYIGEHNVVAGAAFLDAFAAVARRLEQFPHSAQLTEMAGVRATPVQRFPYLIFYTVDDNDVVIHYVRHAARLRPWEQR